MAQQRKVLVVEADGELRALYRIALALDGFDVSEAANGLEALHRVESNVFDLIVLDMGVSALSGRTFLLELSAQTHTRKVPVVIVTDSSKSFNSLNVARVLRKPVSSDQLVETVRQFVTRTAP